MAATDDPKVVQQLADRVVREADRLSRIVDDLLDLSQIEAQEAPSRVPIPGERARVTSRSTSCRPPPTSREVPIHVTPEPPDIEIACDRRQMRSALINLLDNAIKYSGPHEPVEIGARVEGDRVALCVRDHGIGIPTRDLERIFERFYRVDRARSRETGGTGLGLSIVRHVAQAHGGDVTVESREGEGSLFTLHVPIAHGPIANGNGRSSAEVCVMADPPLILVVDDEQSYRDALSVALQREGFLVETAADGPEAIARFDATKPALVLLDVMLPKISGVDVCRDLRARSRVPIIMVTARNSEIDAVVGLEVGADDYVTKPFRLRELIARVRAALRRVPLVGRRGARPARGARCRRRPARRGAPRSVRPRGVGRVAAEGVRAARAADGQRRSRAHPRRADRPDLGSELLRRHQDARRAHQAAAVEARVRLGAPDAHRHRARRRLPLRAAPSCRRSRAACRAGCATSASHAGGSRRPAAPARVRPGSLRARALPRESHPRRDRGLLRRPRTRTRTA